MKANNCAVLLFVFLSLACMREEETVPAYNRGELITAQVDLTRNYENQLWYSLQNAEVTAQNSKMDWDIRFSNELSRPFIHLNSARSMSAYNTGQTRFSEIKDTSGFGQNRKFDAPSGNPDSTAISPHAENQVFIVDLGFDPEGKHGGFIKMMFERSGETYVIRFGKTEDKEPQTATVSPENQYDFSYFSFAGGEQVNIEPETGTYDLLFSQYTHLFQEPFTPYLVTGVLLAPECRAAKVSSDLKFEDITLADTADFELVNRRDVIGYNWKEYSFDLSSYIIYDEITYIIQSQSGLYYKLRFLDFYNTAGNRGAPLFTYEVL